MKSANNDENIIVYVKMRAEDANTYEALGVLMEDAPTYIRIAFSAHNEVVKDEIIVQKESIVKLKILNIEEVKKITNIVV